MNTDIWIDAKCVDTFAAKQQLKETETIATLISKYLSEKDTVDIYLNITLTD